MQNRAVSWGAIAEPVYMNGKTRNTKCGSSFGQSLNRWTSQFKLDSFRPSVEGL